MSVNCKGTFSVSEKEGSLDTSINKLKLSKPIADQLKDRLSGRNSFKSEKGIKVTKMTKGRSQLNIKGKNKEMKDELKLTQCPSSVEKNIRILDREQSEEFPKRSTLQIDRKE